MKVRCGFVTNSSSSSFVIARRKSATNGDILTDIYKCEDYVKSFLNSYSVKYTYFGNSEVKELLSEGKFKEAFDEAMQYLIERAHFDESEAVDFGEWIAKAAYLNDNDYMEFFTLFMRENGSNEEWKNLKCGGSTDC